MAKIGGNTPKIDNVDGVVIEPFIQEVLFNSPDSDRAMGSSERTSAKRLSKTRMFAAILASLILMFSVETISFIQKNIAGENFFFTLKNATDQKN